MKKIIIITMICLAVINIYVGLSLVFKESISLKINSENEEYVKRVLKKELDNVEDIDKVEAGVGFNSGNLSVYYKNGEKITFHGLEGRFDEPIDCYVRENGKSLEDVAMIHFSISFVLIILSIITKIIKLNKKHKDINF